MNPVEGTPVRILIVDDHPVVRAGMEQLIDGEADLAICAGASDADAALQVLDSMPVDLAIVDLALGNADGLELIGEIKSRRPELPVLVLSMHSESLFAERALRAGARGYIMKEEASGKLIEAIRKVLAGGVYLSEGMRDRFGRTLAGIEPDLPLDSLTDRELQVFRLIGQGLSTRKIASELGISPKTVETFREHIKQKLKLKTGIELVQHAALWVQASSQP